MKFWVTTTCILLIPAFCLAGGYQVSEMSARAGGMGHAVICRVNDPSAVWYNPAALTSLEGTQVTGGLSWIYTTRTFEPAEFQNLTVDAEDSSLYPWHVYGSRQMSDRLVLGLGIYEPYGLITEWPPQSSLLAANRRAEIHSRFFTPSVGYKVNEYFSVGGGIDFAFANVEIDRGINLRPDFPVNLFSQINADGADFGFNFGGLFDTQNNWKFAATYKHKIDINVEGDSTFSDLTPEIAPFFPSGTADLTLTLPAQFSLGAAYDHENWSFEGNLTWNGWDSFDGIRINYEPNSLLLRDQDIQRDYENTWTIRMGGEYKMADKYLLRAGFSHDPSPVPDEVLIPLIPDGDRNALSFGFGVDGGDWNADLSYTAAFVGRRVVSGNLLIAGEYDGFENVFSGGFTYRFE